MAQRHTFSENALALTAEATRLKFESMTFIQFELTIMAKLCNGWSIQRMAWMGCNGYFIEERK